MRKFTSVVFIMLLLTSSLLAQIGTGNIFGKVVDQEGAYLPGVAVTVTGNTIAPMTRITSDEGKFRFLKLFPGKNYVIRAELSNFKTATYQGILVAVGKNTELTLIMEITTLQEEVTVVAERPTIDSKSTSIVNTMDYEALQSIPSARDPYAIAQFAGTIQVDRENIGGVEGGQQSEFSAKGEDVTGYRKWTLDGINVGSAEGASVIYWDFDVFEEIAIETGGGGVSKIKQVEFTSILPCEEEETG